jgi:hypothetical protein
MTDAQGATDVARLLDADLACIGRRTFERAHVLDGAFTPSLFSAPRVERLSAPRLRRRCSVVACQPPSSSRRTLAGILLVFVVCTSYRPTCRRAAPGSCFTSMIRRARARTCARKVDYDLRGPGSRRRSLRVTPILHTVAPSLTSRSDSRSQRHHRVTRLHRIVLQVCVSSASTSSTSARLSD